MKALALLLALCAGTAGAACREALILALDISGSVDQVEYRQQIDGLAAALSDAEVHAAFFAMPGATVDLAVFEWSSPEAQRLVLDWTTVDAPATLDRIVATIAGTTRRPAAPPTGLGAAMMRGAEMLAARSYCWRRVLDISGDGKSNTGPRPQDVRQSPPFFGITVNGLVIGHGPDANATLKEETRALIAYFRARVIQGPDAFVETAQGYADYGRAMRRKLLRELQILAVSGVH